MFFPYSVTEILILGFLLRSSISVQVSKKIFEIINKREGIQIIIGVLEKKKKLSRGEGVFFMEKLECVNLLYHWSFAIPPETLRKPLVFWCFLGNIYILFSLYSVESSLWTLLQNSNLLKLLWSKYLLHVAKIKIDVLLGSWAHACIK